MDANISGQEEIHGGTHLVNRSVLVLAVKAGQMEGVLYLTVDCEGGRVWK